MDGGGGVEVVEVVVEWEMGGVGKAENECVVVFVHPRASLSLSDPETEFTGLGLATIGGCIAHRFGIARCNKWPAVEESRLRQKRGAKPFLCGGPGCCMPDTFCVDINNAASLSPVCILFTRREWSWSGDAHPSYLTCVRVQSVHGLIESQAHYFLLPLPDPLRPPSRPPSLPRRTTQLTASDSP